MMSLFRSSFADISADPLMAQRIYLRPPRDEDWAQWAELRAASRNFLVPWEPTWTKDSLTHAAFRRRLRQNAIEWREDSGYGFLIFRRHNDEFLGGITLSNLRRGIVMSANLGYWIGKAHASQGFMSEAVGCILDFAFTDLRLHRVEAACVPENEASKKVLLKCGFTQEGYARRYLRINGEWRDHLLFAAIADEQAGQAGFEGV